MTDTEKDPVTIAEESGDTSAALAHMNADIPDGTNNTDTPPAQVTIDSLLEELGRLNDLDRQRLGTLLRRGQRLATHVQSKVALPEFTGWAQDVQHFMNEFGL